MEIAALPALKMGYTVRPCTLDDVEAVVALMNACAIKTIGEADETVEQTRSDWQRPDFDQAASQRVVLASDRSIVGWAEVHDAEGVVIYTDVYVHPDYENEGIGEYLMAWVEARARQAVDKAPDGARVVLRGYADPFIAIRKTNREYQPESWDSSPSPVLEFVTSFILKFLIQFIK